jgi:hypothetical protein
MNKLLPQNVRDIIRDIMRDMNKLLPQKLVLLLYMDFFSNFCSLNERKLCVVLSIAYRLKIYRFYITIHLHT